MIPLPIPGPGPGPAPAPKPAPPSARDQQLMAKAKELEASFLSEMLQHAGLDDQQGGFGSSPGQDQFASFLRDAQAKKMVDGGGIGLAEKLFHALSRMHDGPA